MKDRRYRLLPEFSTRGIPHKFVREKPSNTILPKSAACEAWIGVVAHLLWNREAATARSISHTSRRRERDRIPFREDESTTVSGEQIFPLSEWHFSQTPPKEWTESRRLRRLQWRSTCDASSVEGASACTPLRRCHSPECTQG